MSNRAKSLLMEEIISDNVNVLRIRELCRDNPGLIASAGLRIRIWSILLLGGVCVEEDAGIMNPYEPCGEMHVLEADVRRTRSSIESFRSSSWRRGLTDILQGEALAYTLFEAFVLRYVENFFCKDESIFLFKAFRLFHLLLLYIDPQLAHHLEEHQFVPELYSPSWFLTMYSRGLELPLLLRQWDMLIAVDDPAFTFFVGLALLRDKRSKLLLADSCDIPEIITDMQIKGEKGVDELVASALKLYRTTPRCFLRYLRVCCVHTPELAPLPQVRSFIYSGGALVPSSPPPGQDDDDDCTRMTEEWEVYAHAMAGQSVRKCMMLSATEFISVLAGTQHTSPPPIPLEQQEGTARDGQGRGGESADLPEGGDCVTGQQCEEGKHPHVVESTQMVVIDIRSSSEIEIGGGGYLPTSIQIEPEFLAQPDALEKWLDHFDSMRGVPIVVVDLPPSQASSGALWKRLLLGQGDGLSQHAVSYESPTSNRHMASNIRGFWSSTAVDNPQPMDSASPFKKAEASAAADESSRPAVYLAGLLLRQGFPRVSVLDGGFPAFVAQLYQSKGRVEPFIIGHDHDKWSNFLVVSGRTHIRTDLQAAKDIVQGGTVRDGNKKGSRGRNGRSTNGRQSSTTGLKRYEDMTEVEVARVALEVATRLGHEGMRKVLEERIEKLLPK